VENLEGLPINAIDLGVAFVLLISGVLAYVRGLVHEVLSVAAWIGAIFATIFFYPAVQPYTRELIPIDLVADLSTGVVMFVLTLVILSLATRAISSRVKDSALNVLDRSLGFLFGLARGALVVCVAYMGFEALVPEDEQPEWVTAARTMPLVRRGAAELYALLPEDTNIELPSLQPDETTMDILKLIAPETTAPEEPSSDGYSNDERDNIEKLIESNQ
jgi:membrane protein required for colicin V production